MSLTPEQAALLEIEEYYRVFDAMNDADRPLRISAGSSFDDDLKIMKHPTPPYWCNVHLAAARDHMQALRRITGQPPGGLAEWPSHAAWTLVRVVIEAASYTIWIASPSSQRERFTRALRMWNRDTNDEITATELAYSLRKRRNLHFREAHRERIVDRLNQLPWRIDPKVVEDAPVAVECISLAARESRCAQPDSAAILWRIASGHAHARSWAHLTSGEFETIEVTDSSTLVRGTVNVVTVCPSIALALGLLEYADWLVAKRSGQAMRLPKSVDLRMK